MARPNFESLDEFFQEIDTYHGGWDSYLEKFMGFPPENRNIELSCYDKLLENEYRPTRQTAEYIAKRREIGDLHQKMMRAGR